MATMAISGFLQQSAPGADKRVDARRKLSLVAQGVHETGAEIEVLIHNISETGLLIESDILLAVEERIEIELPHAGAIWAKVIWASARLFGCEFETRVSPATLSAAQLRSAVGAEVHFDSDQPSPVNERFGARLQRLRTAKGLSQADVADSLGVSAPSISGWEKGRARPKHGRIAALATLLNIPISELLGDPAPERLQDLIDRSRDQIARAIGTSAEKVRIVIEL